MGALYRPDSVTWRINQESVLLLAGGRALLMQLAHPAVAAGVAEHSDFPNRALARLSRTLGLMLALNFGDRRQALAAAAQINHVHRGIRGEGYAAVDPRLLLWVQATLIDSTMVAYGTFVRHLPNPEREIYYWEAQRLGRLLGIPAGAYPSSLRAFDSYVAEMIAGPELIVDRRARELGAAVVRPPIRGLPGLAWLPLEAVTAGLLPPRLREEYGLPWGPAQRAVFASLRRGLPRVLPLLPDQLRVMQPARAANRGARWRPWIARVTWFAKQHTRSRRSDGRRKQG
jgi:uncharacterized protein (DUF2236 family)